jgi:phage terminase large subunit-like protein
MGKKWQCLEYIITTAGTDAENKPCYRDDLYYKRVLAGELRQDNVFIMIREIDDDDDPHDKKCWPKANPFFRSGSPYARTLYETVRDEHELAYNTGDPSKIREWLIMRANRWQTDSENKYFSGCMDALKALAIPREEFLKLTRDTQGHYGFDLGKTLDLSGTAYVAQLPDGRLAFSVHGFMPQDRATEHEHSDRVPYKAWASDGWVTLTPGAVTDNIYVERWIYESEAQNAWRCKEVDYDGHNATDMANRLRDKYGNDNVVEIPQTCASLNQATKRFRELVLAGKVVTEDNPLTFWCLSNAIEIINNYGDVKLSKRHKNDTQRIDPIAAMINALVRLIVKIDNTVDLNEIIMRRGYALG